jgi:hypothetical protein
LFAASMSGSALRSGSNVLTPEQHRAMRDIETCRTAARGGHLDVCPDCGLETTPSYNSCGNRHCPKCHALAQKRWIDERTERILPTHHFHVVLTLPDDLRPLLRRNPRLLYGALFTASARALLDLGHDPRRLGARLGITAVLHTWNRELEFHPHLHCIVSGGGLSPDGQRWIAASTDYLFPTAVLAPLLRGKFLDHLRRLYDRDALDMKGGCAEYADPRAFHELLEHLHCTHWHTYVEPPFGGAQHVIQYLGRYTHRTGISNQRLLEITDHTVAFLTKDGERISVTPSEFIRRFLLHVLPKNFVRIRHYGLMASGAAALLRDQARKLLLSAAPVPQSAAPAPATSPTPTSATDPANGQPLLPLCPRCGRARLVRRELKPIRSIGAPTPTTKLDTS